MIYTLTFNPAIDCVVSIDSVAEGQINRVKTQNIYFGGKGINVSYVLAQLDRPTCAWGFIAGPIGAAFETALDADGIDHDFIHLPAGSTRINTKLRTIGAQGVTETALNGPGPEVDPASLAALFDKLGQTEPGDVVIVSGAAPAGSPEDTYARILASQQDRGVDMVVDATGNLLMDALAYKPLLVKPNDEELAQICDCDPLDVEALGAGARMLQERGARNVLVSRGGAGSLLLDEQGNLHDAPVIPGTLVNSVGAGDSMVAGFIAGYTQARDEGLSVDECARRAFALAQACGSATAFSEGLAERALIDDLLGRLNQ